MKIFFDARYTRTDYHDGISRYSAELGNALNKLTPVTFLISDEKQKKWFPKDASFLKVHPGTSVKEPFTALILNKYKPDVVYSPMQTIGTFGRKYTSVLTPQDMIYYRHPKAPGFLPFFVRAGWWLYHQVYWPQRMLLKGGDIITTVSHTSADDLKKARMTNKPIHVIYNAPQKFTKYPVKHEKTIKNIVYMGSFMPYKNAETLIRGMQWLPGRTLHLLSRISPERKTELQTLVPEGAQVVFHNGVSDDEYERLLADDAILATASLDEGYGIPVAEAMAMGVPVVVSDIPVFHEVGASGALYFDPAKPEDFAQKVCQLDNPKFRKQQIDHGLKHMKQFSWNASARALLKAIKDAL
ncbi:mannosyltransferase [Candidatus Saccharibacteria bacterium 47-87]|nr:glycosyltransferase family 4 protein [Candidatus Saccharibacteria bacterium]OJU96887.1 MAG: mannosyltransferase [Candidatus Saccharibacteria bacterium 47-87]